MKKKFTFLMAALMLLMMFTIPMRALADSYTYNFSTGGTHNSGADPNTNTWVTDYFTILQEKGSSTTAPANYLTAPRWYQNNTVTFTPKNNVTITQIVINCSGSNNGQDITASTGSVSKSGNNSTWTGSITSSTPLVLTMGKQCRPTSLNVTYTTSGGGSSAVATTTEITVPDGFNKDLKKGTTAGTLTATVTETESGDAVDGATVNWLSNNTSVATVNASGEVTLVAEGTVKITATYEGVEDEYEDSHDDYTFTVVDSRYSHSNLIFTAACGGSGTADDGAEWTVTSDADESNFIEGSGIHYGTGSKPVQYIQLETSDIEGQISKVVVNTRDSQSSATVSVTVGGTSFSCSGSTTATNTPTDYTFTGIGSGDIVVRIARSSATNGAIYVNSVKVTYQEVAVKDPVINVPDSFVGSTTATITCETVGANIKYNYDGGSTWNTYTTGLTITETTTIYAKAVKDEDESSVVSKTTTKNYNVNIDNLTHGTITATPPVAAEGIEITLTITPDGCYQLTPNTLVVLDGNADPVSVTNNVFIMPASNVTVSAEFEAITYTVHYSVNGTIEDALEDIVSCGYEASLWDEDDLESEGIEIPAGYTFAGWSTSASSNAVVSSYTPEANATLFAVLVGNVVTKTYSFTISTSDFNKTSYATNDGDHTSVATATTGETMNVTWTTSNVMLSNDSKSIQWRKSPAGSLSATNLGTIISVDIAETSYDALTLSISGGSFSITDDGDDTGYASTVEVVFEKNTTPSYTLVEDVTGTQNIASVEASHLITVKNGGVLTLTGTNNGTAANLIIEDGGQLICSNSVAATVKKNITNASAKEGEKWYAISSSVHDDGETFETIDNVTNLTSGTYDMFCYDEPSNTWFNQKPSTTPPAAGFSTMMRGRGYIYRNAADKELAFTGETNVGTVEYGDEYNYLGWSNKDERLKGFNLVGNPYPHKIYKGVAFATTSGTTTDTLVTGYYALESDGSWTAKTNSDVIDVNQAILVEATEYANGKNLQFKDRTTAPNAKSNNDNIMFTVENSAYSDIAYAWFDNGNGLKKIEHRNANIPMLYINQDGTDYAIAMMSDNTKSFGLNFKAKTMGTYTLSYKAEGNFDYLHVIDRLTGENVDMLMDGKYSFVGSPQDNAGRFIVKLGYDNGSSTGSETFVYQNGNDIIVDGEGTLEVFDVTGRKVMTTNINGVETINGLNTGVYIFRVIGETLRTQKIVVR